MAYDIKTEFWTYFDQMTAIFDRYVFANPAIAVCVCVCVYVYIYIIYAITYSPSSR